MTLALSRALVTVIPLALAAVAAGANPLNPDVSVIGDTRAVWSEHTDEVALAFEELEIGLVGAVNPYARAEVYAAVHGTEGDIEIEEAKLLLDRYLPAGLGLVVGRYLLDLGQLNPVHAHAFPFVDRPLVHAALFGDDGARDVGVRLDWLAPIGATTLRASAAALRGDVFLGGHGHGEEADAHARGEPSGSEEEEEEAEEPAIGASGRAELFVEAGRDVALSVGTTLLAGRHDTHESARAFFIAPDLKARVELGARTALVVNAEAVFGRLDGTDEAPASDPKGWFASADLRPGRWNAGGFVESATERLDDGVRTTRYGAFGGFALMEESTVFRLVVRRSEPDRGDADTSVIVQALFGLGPHAPHRY